MMSSMPESFLDWLNDCPVQWFLLKDDGNGNTEYSFISGGEESE